MEETKALAVEETILPILRHLAMPSKTIQITTTLIMHHTPVPQEKGFGQLSLTRSVWKKNKEKTVPVDMLGIIVVRANETLVTISGMSIDRHRQNFIQIDRRNSINNGNVPMNYNRH